MCSKEGSQKIYICANSNFMSLCIILHINELESIHWQIFLTHSFLSAFNPLIASRFWKKKTPFHSVVLGSIYTLCSEMHYKWYLRGFIRSRLLLCLLPPIISINYNNFHNFLGNHALQTSVGKVASRLFLPQPPTSQNQPLTIKLIETPGICRLETKFPLPLIF